MASFGEYARQYATRGIPVFPLAVRQKTPLIGKKRGGRGFHDATTNIPVITAWWEQWPQANIGMPTGAKSGYTVLDIDPRNGGSIEAVVARYGALPETLTARTGGGGWHFYYATPADHHLRSVDKALAEIGLPGTEIKAEGRYVVAPPSVHPTGNRYLWLPDGPKQLAPAPPWIIELCVTKAPETVTAPSAPVTRRQQNADAGAFWLAKAIERTGEGIGDATGFWLAQQLLCDAQVSDPYDVLMEYAAQATRNPHDPFDEESVARWLRSARQSNIVARGEPAKSIAKRAVAAPALRLLPTVDDEEEAPPAPPDEPPDPPEQEQPDKSIHRTDLGNARRFVRRHGSRVRYVSKWGKWLLWDGTRWKEDATDQVVRFAKETVGSIYSEASDTDDDEERRELAKWAMRSEADARIRAMLSLAESEPEIALAPEQLDQMGWLLNCRNGGVDLRTGALQPHAQAQLCTKRAEVDYVPSAACPTWLRFLADVFAGDAELIAYVQRALGYSLTSEVSEQCVFIPHGHGANGKSTFLDTLVKLLADYAMTTPTDTLMVKNGQSIPSDVARLVGARFVSASESGDGRRLDEELIKRISGGDRMSARFLHHDWFEFYPVLKLWLAVNHKPSIRGTDNGIWRRIHLIPFTVTFAPEKQDRHLLQKLSKESAGIFAWMVQGCLAWQRDGLQPPKVVQDATAEYRNEMDTMGSFLAECCVIDRHAQVTNKALRQAYKSWCDENAERELPQNRFSQSLADRGLEKSRVHDGSTLWRGIGLKSAPVQGSFE